MNWMKPQDKLPQLGERCVYVAEDFCTSLCYGIFTCRGETYFFHVIHDGWSLYDSEGKIILCPMDAVRYWAPIDAPAEIKACWNELDAIIQ